MNFALFYHSVRSDWNHGNAHFLRGIVRALQGRSHRVTVLEPEDAWSVTELVKDQGPAALDEFTEWFPDVRWCTYRPARFDADEVLDGVDVAIVHEWTDPAVVASIGRFRVQHSGLTLLFHDTHHRMVSDPNAMAGLALDGYDAVLAFGAVLARAYERAGWGRRAFTWHEAADVSTFFPRNPAGRAAAAAVRGPDFAQDVIWVGNWGDGERAEELGAYLIAPVERHRARLTVHGVRYPPRARRLLERIGADYRGWIPGPRVPDAFARSRLTVHVPRRWYRTQLAGIPTIRVFEALACGIPLISAPWEDVEGLFRAGEDYLLAADPGEMSAHMGRLLADPDECASLGRHGLERILDRHTCAHRAEQLEQLLAAIGTPGAVRQVVA